MELIARYRTCEPRAQLLKAHLEQVASLGAMFGKDFHCAELLSLSSLMHDAGKASEKWQEYLKKSVDNQPGKKIDHATAGAQLIQQLFSSSNILIPTALEAVVMFHHGSGLPDMICPDGSSDFLKRINKDKKETQLDEIEKAIQALLHDELDTILKSLAFAEDGKTVLLDPCKKNAVSKKQLFFNMGLHLRNLSSCLIDADRTDSAAFEECQTVDVAEYDCTPDWSGMLDRLESHLAKVQKEDTLGKIRSDISSKCALLGTREKGICTCSAFTGAGKTLASLRFALNQAKKFNMHRIFIVAPYTSILDQNAEVIRSILEDDSTRGSIVLECHSNLSVEKKTELKESEENYARFEETWNAPVIITTMVQFLETLFASGTKKIRRMHKLVNSVLVFDEVQTLPVKTTFLFNWGLEYLVNVCGCSALLCTATQPSLAKIGDDEKFHLRIDAEVVDNLPSHFDSLKRVDFIDMTDGGRKTHSLSEIAEYIKIQMQDINSFLAVVNTKPQAKELFELLKDSKCADLIYHLSTNMCPAHRKDVIQKIRKNLELGKQVVCISTRLIEAGVDLSFEGSLRFMAGIDSIIQTAGRCNRNNELRNRNGKPVHGKLAIFSCEKENLGSLEELKIAQSCMERVLREIAIDHDTSTCNLIQPDAISSYFNYFYASLPESLLKYPVMGKDSTVLDMLSDNASAVAEYRRTHDNAAWKLPYMQSFRTAWENFEVIADATTGIIVYYGEGFDLIGAFSALEKSDENFYSKLKVLLKKAQQYTVNVYSNQLQRLGTEGMIFEVFKDSGIYALREEYYNSNFGLTNALQSSDTSCLSVLSF